MIKKFNGGCPKVLHSVPELAITGEPFSISAACRAYGGNAPERLVMRIEGGKEFYLLPSDRYERLGTEYMIYRADIPASVMKGDSLVYRIDAEGEINAKLPPYICKLIDKNEMPELPPLAITEIFGRPKGKEFTAYIELFNPTDKDVDLYDYEVLVFSPSKDPLGMPKGRLPLSREAGVNILGAGATAACWPLTLKNYAPEINCLTVESFISQINSAYLYTKEPIDETKVNVIPVDYTEIDPESGARKNIEGICALPSAHDATTLLIVPRGGDESSAVFTLLYSNC
jgi:hypothetical protein